MSNYRSFLFNLKIYALFLFPFEFVSKGHVMFMYTGVCFTELSNIHEIIFSVCVQYLEHSFFSFKY